MSDGIEDPTGMRYYGSDMTVHRTNQLDVETDKDGKVVAVWFRCQALPFQQSTAEDWRAEEMRNMYMQSKRDGWGIPPIEAVVLREQS